jgi:S-formylglutathione hydrolase FrmB
MKKFLTIMILIPTLCLGQVQYPEGKVIVERITSQYLQNKGGENPTRRVSVYLPLDYDKTTTKYPVIYYFDGFGWNDSLDFNLIHFNKLFDKAISTGKIRPVIIVIPNQCTLFGGSFYTNSSLTGMWSDFTAKDLVAFIDKNYRTIPNKDSRGLSGVSMGGHGAIKIGMLFPDVFSSIYALSPAFLGLAKEFGPTGNCYKKASQLQTVDELQRDSEFNPKIVVAVGRAFSPNLDKPPFYADLPFTYSGDQLIIHDDVLDLWNKNMPIQMIDTHIENLRKLKALKLDWGRNDEFAHIPLTCEIFSQKLENLGINHYAEEYIGTHTNKVITDDGRFLNEVLPFFDTYLTFDEKK